ncbi:hypothetical protein [Devosia aurantiaca]|uniref:Uncharacterized protein n=1 Tax=Devosia aurantiaca TaxID=2714858 RepID=A0A6M1SMP6_9HYPH|nr:hypothetical protein [Devosia aurantiaca]NGP18400.1 hypothetical protein [Devosia aurantiaca]
MRLAGNNDWSHWARFGNPLGWRNVDLCRIALADGLFFSHALKLGDCLVDRGHGQVDIALCSNGSWSGVVTPHGIGRVQFQFQSHGLRSLLRPSG